MYIAVFPPEDMAAQVSRAHLGCLLFLASGLLGKHRGPFLAREHARLKS
jgi:hypothetical protein